MDWLTNHLDNYFALNLLPDTSPTTLWTAHKAVMWGHLIHLPSKKHRTKLADLRSLTKTLDRLYNHYNQSPTPNLLEHIKSTKNALDTLLSEDMERALRWSKAKFLLLSNSASTMKLNHMIKPPHVYKLRNSSGSLVSHPNDILGIFVNYY